MTTTTGIIQRIYHDKGFGFVRDPKSGIEHFFHRSAVEGSRFEELDEGTEVTFEIGHGAKGPRAESVRIVG